MDVVKAVETYITKMVSVPSAMKVLLLDSHTVRASHDGLALIEPRPFFSDTDSVPSLDAVRPSLTSGLPHRSHRQQQARTHGSYEMRVLPAE